MSYAALAASILAAATCLIHLTHRGRMDGTPEVSKFAGLLEETIVKTVEAGDMTKDLALLIGPDQGWLTTQEFINKVGDNFEKAMSAQ